MKTPASPDENGDERIYKTRRQNMTGRGYLISK